MSNKFEFQYRGSINLRLLLLILYFVIKVSIEQKCFHLESLEAFDFRYSKINFVWLRGWLNLESIMAFIEIV